MTKKGKKNLINKRESKIMLVMTGILLAVAGTVLVLTGQLSTLNIMGNSTHTSYYTCPSDTTEGGATVTYYLSGSNCIKKKSYPSTLTCPSGYTLNGGICKKNVYVCDSDRGYEEYKGRCRKAEKIKKSCSNGYELITSEKYPNGTCRKTVEEPICPSGAQLITNTKAKKQYCESGEWYCTNKNQTPQKISGQNTYGCYEKVEYKVCDDSKYSSSKYRVVQKTDANKSITKCYVEEVVNRKCPEGSQLTKNGNDYVCRKKISNSKKCETGWTTKIERNQKYCIAGYKKIYGNAKEIPTVTKYNTVQKGYAKYKKYATKFLLKKRYVYTTPATTVTKYGWSEKTKLKVYTAKQYRTCGAGYTLSSDSLTCTYTETVSAIYHSGSSGNVSSACSRCENIREYSSRMACKKRNC